MGLIDSNSIMGIAELIGFKKRKRVSQQNRTFPYEEGYITSSDVYAVTSKIAKNGKGLGWNLKINRNGVIEDVTDGDLYDLIQNPNKAQSRAEFVEMALLFLLLSGEVFEKKLFSEITSRIEAVDLLNPQLVTINTRKIGFKYEPKDYKLDGWIDSMDPEIIEHLKYANPTTTGERTLRGLSPLVAGYLTLIGLNNNQEANATILEHQGAAGILTNESDQALTETEHKVQQSALDRVIAGIKNFGKIVQSFAKTKFIRLGLDPSQLKLIESKILMFRDLCAIYDTKSILFNDPVNASFNNLISAEKSHWLNAVIPNTQLIVDMFSNQVVNDFNTREFPGGKSFYFIQLDISKITVLQADLKKEAEKDRIKMEGVDKILNMPISSPAKIELLVIEYDYTVETAEIIVNPEGKKNEQLEILQSLSPLLANKLIENLSEAEARAIIGL